MSPVEIDISSVSWWDGSAIYYAFTVIVVSAVIAWIVSAIVKGSAGFSFAVAGFISFLALLIGSLSATVQLESRKENAVVTQIEDAGFKEVTVSGIKVHAEAPDGMYAKGVIYWEKGGVGEVIWR